MKPKLCNSFKLFNSLFNSMTSMLPYKKDKFISCLIWEESWRRESIEIMGKKSD